MATAKKAPPKPVAPWEQPKKNPVRPADPNSKTAKKLASHTEENLTPRKRQRADLFIIEYLRDYNATRAYRRTRLIECPFDDVSDDVCSQQGYEMKRWPYVSQKIQEAFEIAEEKNVVTRTEVLHGLKREALFHGPGASHGARVSGWGKLATIMGMDQKQVERGLSMKGGIMVVPAVEGLDDWEQRAQAAQAALKEEVRK